MLNFDDRLLLHNTSGKDVTILDYQNPPKPYAQLLADGTVQVNTNSEAYYLNEDRLGETSVPKNLGTEPKWKQLSRSARFEWHDHRAHWMGKGDPPGLKDKSVKTKIDDWDVPIQVAGQQGAISGTLTWVPLDEGGPPAGGDLRLRRAADRALDRGLRDPPPARGGRRRRRPAKKEVVEAW